jgi:hypothetical protein
VVRSGDLLLCYLSKQILMAAILISEWVRSGELQLYFLSKQILMGAILIFSTWYALVI